MKLAIVSLIILLMAALVIVSCTPVSVEDNATLQPTTTTEMTTPQEDTELDQGMPLTIGEETNEFCEDVCGNGVCEELVCMAEGCPCAENVQTCPEDCA